MDRERKPGTGTGRPPARLGGARLGRRVRSVAGGGDRERPAGTTACQCGYSAPGTARPRPEGAEGRYSRDAIDAAIVLVIDLQRQIATATQNAAWTERQRTHYGDLGDRWARKGLKRLDYDMKMELLPLGERVLEMHQFTIRLGLRLGSRHAIPTLNTDLMNKWCECVNSLRPAAQRNRRDDEAVASEKLAEEASDVQAKFTAECELWFQ